MKGLLLKDLYILNIYKRNALIMLLVALAVSFTSAAMLPGFLLFITSTYLIGLFSYDDTVDWEKFQRSLPVSPQKAVAARYAVSFGLLAAVGIVSFVLGLIPAVLAPLFTATQPMDVLSLGLTTLVIFLLCALIITILLPLCYKLGPEKVRLAMLAVYAGVVAMVFAFLFVFGKVFGSSGPGMLGSGAGLALLLSLAVCLIAGFAFLSLHISVRINSKKEF